MQTSQGCHDSGGSLEYQNSLHHRHCRIDFRRQALGDIGKGLGEGIRNFKSAVKDEKDAKNDKPDKPSS